MKIVTHAMIAAMVSTIVGCGGDGASSSSGSAGNRLEPADKTGITFSYNPMPITLADGEKIQLDTTNALEFARLALVKATAFAINAQVNVGNLQSAESLFAQDQSQFSDTCPQGGMVQVSKFDQNGNFQIDAGDSFTVSFTNCQNANGSLQTDYDSYSGSVDSGALTTNSFVTARSFKATQPSTRSTAEASGTEGRRIVLGAGRYQYIANAPKNHISETEAGKGSSDYMMTMSLDVQGNQQGANNPTVRMNLLEKGDSSTRIDIPKDKAYTAQADGLAVALTDNAVADGNLVIESGGRLLIQALGNSSGRYLVRVGLDGNADGTVERTCDFDYGELMNGTASFQNPNCSMSTPPTSSEPVLGNLPLLGSLVSNVLGTLLPR
ncbi:MAG TPA: hypothetical protein VGE55_06485 [Limnobacter sp.]|uniref:hypothetical protein n=1 Tax=Limnobacter sp. TaxID=2003368 RepID=UPI002ED98A08